MVVARFIGGPLNGRAKSLRYAYDALPTRLRLTTNSEESIAAKEGNQARTTREQTVSIYKLYDQWPPRYKLEDVSVPSDSSSGNS